ncbi:MAG: asparagine synthetase B family protein, partial [Pirellulaceae bacterium]|nr:asparagine synthetase B family protein [Pirellulaceae bacterium]
MTVDQATQCVRSGDAARVGQIEGQFALVARDGQDVRLARTIGRPMRYFLAKQSDGPCLIVAERIDEIRDQLQQLGLGDQFHPSYTRMVPAHHLLHLRLIGCPDPNPTCDRFFTPERNRWPADVRTIGRQYMQSLVHECGRWLDSIGPREPIGVLFSGGIDSGSVLLAMMHTLLARGENPARLKAFTLAIDGVGPDAEQARRFLQQLDLEMLLEVIDVPAADIDWRETIRVLEDYKRLDVEAATMGLALCKGIRTRYPEWKWLVDGDGGDENLKDYPIEDNPELTIRSVLNNLMLYQEGWGVQAIKHSLTFSGGQSRGHVRSFAPAQQLGFQGFSPYALPSLIEVAEGIPFVELTNWQHDRLYELKGQIVHAGIQAVTGWDMPIF